MGLNRIFDHSVLIDRSLIDDARSSLSHLRDVCISHAVRHLPALLSEYASKTKSYNLRIPAQLDYNNMTIRQK